MRNVRKSLNLISLFVLVCVNIFSPFSYAGLDDFSVQEENNTEIEETTIEEESNDDAEGDKEDTEDGENSGDEGYETIDGQNNDDNEGKEDSSNEAESIDGDDSDKIDGGESTGLEDDINEDDDGIGNETEDNTEDPQDDKNITSGDNGGDEQEGGPNNDNTQSSQTNEQITDNNSAGDTENGNGGNTQESEEDSSDSELEDMPKIGDDTKTPIDMLALDFEKPENEELQTQATANVTEPYGHVEYDLNENEHFEAQMITISDGDTTITILDRNLGATTAGTGACEDSSLDGNCFGEGKDDSTYGYHFQWGNNYGFKPCTDSDGCNIFPNSENTGAQLTSLTYDPFYTDSVFRVGNANWLSDNSIVGLWGGSEADNTYSLDDTTWHVNNPTERKGPCPENFHVPSIGELDKLKTMLGDDEATVRNKLLVPFAGGRDFDNSVKNLGSYADIWSSSPVSISEPTSQSLYLSIVGDMDIYFNNRGYADSIRCFKDTYTSGDINTITFDFNGGTGETTTISVLSGEFAQQPVDPSMEGGIFLGWYLTGSDTVFDFSETPIIGDITLYAKWNTITVLLPGQEFNKKIKSISKGSSVTSVDVEENNIISIERYLGDSPNLSNAQEIQESGDPVYAWFDDGVLYYYSNADEIYINPDSTKMFFKFKSLTGFDFTQFETSLITGMESMFHRDSNLESINMSGIYLKNVENITNIFTQCTNLKEVDMQSISFGKLLSLSNLFRDRYLLEKVDLTNADFGNVTNLDNMFVNDSTLKEVLFENLKASNVTSISGIFGNCTNLESVNMKNADFRSVGSLLKLFESKKKIKAIDMSNLNVSSATDLSYMFNQCTGVELINMENIDARSATNIVGMFNRTSSLKKINMSNSDFRGITSLKDFIRDHKAIEEINMSGMDIRNVTSMSYMFYNDINLKKVNLTNTNVENLITTDHMFQYCTSLTGIKLNFKNTDKIENMQAMFYGASSLVDIDIHEMTLNNVSKFNQFLYNCTSLTGIDLSGLTINSGQDMSEFFRGCTNLKKVNLSNSHLNNVQNMSNFFRDCSSLEDVNMSNMIASGVTTIGSMFRGTTSLRKVDMSNADLRSIGSTNVGDMNQIFQSNLSVEEINMSGLNISSATRMDSIFNGCTNLKEVNLTNIDARNATNIGAMFSNTTSLKKVDMTNADFRSVPNLNQFLQNHKSIEEFNIEGANLSSVNRLDMFFDGASNLKKVNFKNLDARNATTMSYMFRNCSSLTGIVLDFKNINNLKNMEHMFEGAGIQRIDLSKLPTNKIDNMKYFLSKCPLTGVDFSGLYFSSLSGVNRSYFFNGCTGLQTVDMSNAHFENVQNMDHLFNDCSNLENISMQNMVASGVTNVSYMFAGTTALKKVDMSNSDLRSVGSMEQLLKGNTSIEEIDMEGMNLSGLTRMDSIFNGCTSLKEVNLTNIDAKNTTNIGSMFSNTTSLKKVDMSNADLRSIGSMERLFNGNTSIEEINMEGMNLSGLTRMDYMFNGCTNLKKVNFANIYTENLKRLNQTFAGCSGLVLVNFSGFVADTVTTMNAMFEGCTSLETLDLSTLNFRSIPSVDWMFHNASNLKTIYVGQSFNPDNIGNGYQVFSGATSIVGGNGTVFDSTKLGKEYAKIDDENNIGYFTNKNHFALKFVNPSGRTLGKQWKSVGTTGTKLNDGDDSIQYYTDSTQQTAFDFQEPLRHYTEVYTIGDNIVYQINFYNNDKKTIFSGILAQAGQYLPMKRYYTHPDVGGKYWFDGWYTSSGDFSIGNRFEFDKENIEDTVNLYPHRLEYEDITYFDAENPDEIITYMDRNLGAITADINNTGSYGYHYQWGNNHGFTWIKNGSRDFQLNSKENTTNVKFTGLQYFGPNNPYYSSTFYYAAQSDWADPGNDNMYGGAGDSANNLWGLIDESKTDRQGPCPEGYHVPSIGELDKLIDIRLKNKYVKNDLTKGVFQHQSFTEKATSGDFKEELSIPFAGYRYDQNGLIQNIGNQSRYLSSTPMRGLTIGEATDTYQQQWKTTGEPIRCFKDESADIITHSVTLNSNGGDKLRTLYARHGETLLKKPSNPTKPNSVFTGWYTNSQLTQKFDLDSPISNDITLYAKRECEIGSLLSDDGEYCIKDGENYQRIVITGTNNEIIQVNHQTWKDLILTYGDTKITIMDRNLGATRSGTNNPLSDGSNFEINGYYYQWGNNYGFSGPKDLLQETTTQPVETIGYGPNNYYANNIINNSTWDQSYNQNLWGGLSGTDEAMQGPCPDGYHIPRGLEMVKLRSIRCAEEMNNENCGSGVVFFSGLNMPFAGWKSSSDMMVKSNGSIGYYWESQRASLQQGYRFKVRNVNIEPNSRDAIQDGYTIRCFKNTKPKTITYQLNSGDNNQNNPTNTSSWWEEGTPLLSGTRFGYVFKGWYSTSGFDTGTQVTTNSFGSNIEGENIILYANWEPNKYTITYKANGGEGEDIIDGVAYDSGYTVINNPFIREGYTLSGWNTQSDGNGQSYEEGFSGVWNATDNMTLYAEWKPNKYTITYKANGGEGEDIIDEVTYDSGYTVINNPFIRGGYTLSGWNTQSDGNGQSYEEGFSGVWNVAENITLYAEWIGCLTYETIAGTDNLRITGLFNNDKCKTNLVIPNKIDDKWITEIGNDAFYDKGLTGTLTFQEPSHLTRIGDNAFRQNGKLVGILDIPATVTEIGNKAFMEAFNVNTENYLVGGEGIINLGNDVFKDNKLTGILKIPSGLTAIYEQYRGNSFTGIDFNNAQIATIGQNAFADMKTLEGELEIPNTVTTIGNGAFYQAFSGKTINSLTGGEGIIDLGADAFKNNKLVGILKIPSGLTAIYEQYRGNSFTGIDFNNAQITIIGQNAFVDMKTLEGELEIPNTVTTIGNGAFYQAFSGKTINSLTGGEGIIDLGADAFKNNKLVGILKIPSGLTAIYEQYRGNSFTGIDFNNAQITIIGQNAFHGMQTLEGELEIPNTVTTIGNSAFYQAFSGNTINTLTGGEGITDLGADAFKNNKLTGILKIPSGLTAIYEQYRGNSFTGIDFNNAQIITIGQNAFIGMQTLEGRLEIPNTVTSIGDGAFYNNKLSTINFLSGATVSVNASAFCNNSGVVQGYRNGADVTVVNPNESCFHLNDQLVLNVSFDSQIPGSGINTVQINYNEYATKPDDILSGDYILNWYQEGSDIEFDFENTPIKDDITLYGERDEYGVENVCYKTLRKGDGTILIIGLKDGASDECKINPVIPNRILDEGWVSEIGNEAFYNKGLSGTLTFSKPSHITTIGSSAFKNNNITGTLEIPGSVGTVNGAFSCNPIEKVIFGTGITTINDEAFRVSPYNCDQNRLNELKTIKSVEFPSTLTSIGYDAFQNQVIEGELKLPEGLTNIGNDAFYGNNISGTLKIPGGIGTVNGAFSCNPIEKIIFGTGITTINDEAFRVEYRCNSSSHPNEDLKTIKSVEFPSTLTSIGARAFERQIIEGELKLPDSLTNIGDGAFFSNNISGTLEIPGGIGTVNNAFSCNPIEKVVFGTGITTINSQAFRVEYNCDSSRQASLKTIKSVEFPSTLTSIGQEAFEEHIIEGELKLPNSLTSIGSRAFYNNHITGELILPNSLQSIGDNAFSYNAITGTLVIPGGVTTVTSAFKCTKVEKVVFEEGVRVIKPYVFESYCSDGWGNQIKSVEFPSTLTGIGDTAFNGQAIENNLILPESLESVGSSAFNGNKIQSVYIPKATTEIKGFAFSNRMGNHYTTGYTTDIKDNIDYLGARINPLIKLYTYTFVDSGGNVLGTGYYASGVVSDMTKLIQIDNYIDGTEPTTGLDTLFGELPEGYIVEWDYLPSDNIATEDLVVTGNVVFSPCKFRYSNDSNGLRIDGFSGEVTELCLNNFIIPEKFNNKPVLSITYNAFDYDSTNVKINSDVIIPNSITYIGDSAFKGNNIKSLTLGTGLITIMNNAFANNQNISGDLIIPDSVTKIGDGAFNNSYNGAGTSHRLILGNNITSMGSYAFTNNEFQGDLIIPNSVTSLGSYAFKQTFTHGDNNTLTIGTGLSGLWGYDIFYGNKFTGDLIIPKNIKYIEQHVFLNAYRNPDSKLIIEPGEDEGEGLVTIKQRAFVGCTFTGELILPNTVETIGWNAFDGAKFTNLVLGSGLTSIGYETFKSNSLSNLDIPDNVTSIDEGGFSSNKLSKLNIGKGISVISKRAFENNKLTNVLIPQNIIGIESKAFCSNDNHIVTGYILNDNVEITGDSCLNAIRLYSYTYLDSGGNVLGTGYYLSGTDSDITKLIPIEYYIDEDFDEESLISVESLYGEIPEGYGLIFETSIPEAVSEDLILTGEVVNMTCNFKTSDITFDGVSGLRIGGFSGTVYDYCLEHFEIPKEIGGKTVISIGQKAFYNEGRLKGTLIIPNTIKEIGLQAFYYSFTGATNNYLVFEEGSHLTSISDAAFQYNNFGGVLKTPEGITKINNEFAWNPFTGIDFSRTENLTEIGYNAFGSAHGETHTLEGTLRIPSTVTKISDYAFVGIFSGNTENYLTFEDGSRLSTIGFASFNNNNLTGNLVLPESLTYIGDSAFRYNNFIGELVIPRLITGLNSFTFYKNKFSHLDLTQTENLKTIGNNIFGDTRGGSYSLQGELIIPNTVESLGYGAFWRAFNGTTENYLTFENGSQLTSIGDYAFSEDNLTGNLTLPELLTGLGNSAFSWNNLNGELIIPRGITELKSFTFYRNKFSHLDLTQTENLKTIGNNIFGDTRGGSYSLQGELIIPNTVESLGYGAFWRAFNGTTENYLTFENGSQLTSIGDYAFSEDNFRNVFIPNSITSISGNSFNQRNKSVTGYTLDIKSSIDYTGAYIKPIIGLYTYTFTDNQGNIFGTGYYQSGIVSDMTKLISIDNYIYETQPTIEIDSFFGELPAGYVVQWQGLPEDSIATEDLVITGEVVDITCKFKTGNYNGGISILGLTGKIYDYCLDHFVIPEEINGKPVLAIQGFKDLGLLRGQLIIPDTVVYIGVDAFNGAFSGLTENTLILGTGLNTVSNDAFYGNNFTGTLNLPNSLTTIGQSSFGGNNFNGELKIPSKITNINRKTFYGNKFTKIDFSDANSLTSIGSYAFAYMKTAIGDLIIPNSLTSIDEGAFYYAFTGENNTLTLGTGLQSADKNAFNGNNFTGNLILPESLTKIEYGSFAGNKFNGKLKIPSQLSYIRGSAFKENKFTKLDFSDANSLTSIGSYAFAYMKTATGDLIIPNSVTSIDEGAFYYAFTGENNTLTLGTGLQSADKNAFAGNIFQRNLFLPESLSSIYYATFSRNTGTNYTTGYTTDIKNIDYAYSYIKPIIKLYTYTFTDNQGNILGTGYYQSGVVSYMTKLIQIDDYIYETEPTIEVSSLYGTINSGYKLRLIPNLPEDNIATEDLVIAGKIIKIASINITGVDGAKTSTGIGYPTKIIYDEDQVFHLPKPYIDGKIFLGWKVGDTDEIEDTPIIYWGTDGKTITAVWEELDNFTVSFNTNGSLDIIPDQVITEGRYATKPSNPTRGNGFIFSGWYLSGDDDEFDFENTPITGDITLYAKWRCNDGYRLSHDGTVCVLHNSDTEFEDLDIYFLNKLGNISHVTLMDRNLGATEVYNQRFSTSEVNTGSFGYHYQWGNNYGFKPCTPTGGNECNGFPGGESQSTSQVPYETWSMYIPSKYSNNVFVAYIPGWMSGSSTNNNIWGGAGDYSDRDGTGTKVDRQGPCPDGYYIPSTLGWRNIIGQWQNSTRNNNGVQLAYDFLLPPAGSRTYGKNVKPNDGGHYYSSSPNGTDQARGMGFGSTFVVSQGSDANANAIPIRCFKNTTNPRILSLEPNGGTGAIISLQSTGDSHHKIVALGTPSRANSDFGGWYTTYNFRGNKVQTGDIFEGDITLYAKRSCVPGYISNYDGTACVAEGYEITYDLDGGSRSGTANQTTYKKSSNDIILSGEVSRLGYTFLGWTGTGLDSPTSIITIPANSIGNRNYTANWNINTYRLTILGVSGATNNIGNPYMTGKDYTVEDLVYLSNPKKDGAEFIGWEVDGEVLDSFILFKSTGDKTIKALWNCKEGYAEVEIGEEIQCVRNSFKVTYNPNGGAFAGMSVNVKKDVTYTKNISGQFIPDMNIQSPNKEKSGMTGWMFDGWYLDTGYNTERTGFMNESMDLQIIYAKWLPFKDLNVTLSGMTFTIMDRNLGASDFLSGYSYGDTDSNKIGKYYQRGNNFGFQGDGNIVKTGNQVDGDGYGPGNYYYNSTFIYSDGRWTFNDNTNLWGGENENNPDVDKQGPCPLGYHIPTKAEWDKTVSLFNSWKATEEGSGYCNSLDDGTKSDNKYCFSAKLGLPFGGLYNQQGGFIGKGNDARYRSSSRMGDRRGWLITNATVSYYRRVHGLNVRCFKNTISKPLSFETNGGNVNTTISSALRWRENGTKLPTPTTTDTNRTFAGRYTTSDFKDGTRVFNNAISTDDTNNTLTVYAKWNCKEGYISNSDGTGCVAELYEVTYDLNGGSRSGTANQTTYQKSSSDIILSGEVSKLGYTFTGWTGTDLDSPTSIITIPANSIGNRSYTANWNINTYRLTILGVSGATNNIGNPYMTGRDYTVEDLVYLSDPKKDGANFAGWEVNSEVLDSFILFKSTGDKTIKALWNCKEGYTEVEIDGEMQCVNSTFRVIYNLNGGAITTPNPSTWSKEDGTITLNNPTKQGYTFSGWYDNDNIKIENLNWDYMSGLSSTTLNLTAKYSPNSNTTYYVEHQLERLDGGYKTEETETLSGTTDAEITPAVKTYIGFTSPATQTTTINPLGITRVIYKYTRDNGKLIVNYNGGKDSDNRESIEYIQKYGSPVEEIIPTREGYTFAGWDSAYPKTMPAGETTIIAQWTTNQYTITYRNVEYATNLNDKFGYSYGENFTLSGATREGYVFNGWYTQADGQGTKVESITATDTGDKVLYAYWIPATNTRYTVVHIRETISQEIIEDDSSLVETEILSGTTLSSVTPATRTYTGFTSPATQTVQISPDGSTVVKYIYHRKQYNFQINSVPGANTQGSSANTKYFYEEEITLNGTGNIGYIWVSWDGLPEGVSNENHITFTMPANNVSITPILTHIVYTITFDSNGGVPVSVPNQTGYYEDTLNLPNVYREGYVFQGWYEGNNRYDGTTKLPNRDVNLKAKWTEEEHHGSDNILVSVKYYLMGLDGQYPTIPTDTLNISLPVGEIYTGTLKNYEGFTSPDEQAIIVSDENNTIEYRYSRNKYSLILNQISGFTYNGLSGVSEHYYGEKITLNGTIIEGYIWSGWDGLGEVAAHSSNPWIQFNMPASGVIATPNITPNTYKVIFRNGEDIVAQYRVKYLDIIPIPATPTKQGYTFAGWKGLPSDGKMIADSLDIRAQWTQDSGGGGGGGGSSGGGGGGGGKRMPTIDEHGSAGNAPTSGAIADEPTTGNNKSDNISDGQYGSGIIEGAAEMEQAYNFSYKNGITTVNSFEKAKMYGNLTRIQMAKMLSYFAINVLGQKPNTLRTIEFTDVSDRLNAQYDNAVVLAYQLGIMGINMKNNMFRPNDEVTRAEFATALSRMLYHIEDGKGNTKYYEPHIAKLYKEGIITKTDPKMKERRGYVMLMLMRSVK